MFNIIMAVAIALIIAIIASVKDARIKALVYGLPIPITLALIASQKGVNGSHVVGLALLTGFLWLVAFLYEKGLPIIIADIISVGAYISVGYLALKPLSALPFVMLCTIYACLWGTILMFLILRGRKPISTDSGQSPPKKVNVWIKGLLVFSMAYALLEVKDILAGLIVTFPFSGVFAVFEARNSLYTFAKEFTKNSIAILVFFIAVYLLQDQLGLMASIGFGWLAYVLTLRQSKKIA